MSLQVEVSVGEFLDKITILEIKAARIQDAGKLLNVQKELSLLRQTWAASPLSQREQNVTGLMQELQEINESLWDIEDRLRRKEAAQAFDDEFIQLARSVYEINDERAAIKREINRLMSSGLIEEKSYPDYSSPSS